MQSLAFPMFHYQLKDSSHNPLYEWLLANKQQIRAGAAEYLGTPINERTEFQQFKYVISLGVVTLRFSTAYYLPTPANGHLEWSPYKYASLTLLFGWWGFPWGPIYSVEALLYTLGSSRKRTAASLLQLLEFGWDGPRDATTNEHRKRLIEITPDSAVEIRRRLAAGGFSADLAVQISPRKRDDNEVAIAFDYPVSDGRDWVDKSQGLLVLIDKNHESQLAGRSIEFRDGMFWVVTNQVPAER